MSVHCLNGCGRQWPRDPVLEVECPTCKAGVGVRCKRPSGWTTWGASDVHAERDIAADRAGKYGVCPLQRCGLAVKEHRAAAAPEQMNLL